MTDFYIGQKVVCIADFSTHPWYVQLCPNIPVKGTIYHIRDVGLGTSGCGIRLTEISNPVHYFWIDKITAEPAFHKIGFKPLLEKKTDISIFKKMLNPSKVYENI